jgi:hypothetical protein
MGSRNERHCGSTPNAFGMNSPISRSKPILFKRSCASPKQVQCFDGSQGPSILVSPSLARPMDPIDPQRRQRHPRSPRLHRNRFHPPPRRRRLLHPRRLRSHRPASANGKPGRASYDRECQSPTQTRRLGPSVAARAGSIRAPRRFPTATVIRPPHSAPARASHGSMSHSLRDLDRDRFTKSGG